MKNLFSSLVITILWASCSNAKKTEIKIINANDSSPTMDAMPRAILIDSSKTKMNDARTDSNRILKVTTDTTSATFNTKYDSTKEKRFKPTIRNTN